MQKLVILAVAAAALAAVYSDLATGATDDSQNFALEERYGRCLFGPTECTVQEQLDLMRALHKDEGHILQRVINVCADARYIEGCIDPESTELRQWRQRHGHMHDLMVTMGGYPPKAISPSQPAEDADDRMSMMEPAAGNDGASAMERKDDRWRFPQADDQ